MAKRFQFRLEPVLLIRKAKQNEQRRVVADRARACQSAREVLASLESRVAETLTHARQSRSKPIIDVGLVLQEQRWRLGLHRRIHATVQQMNDADRELADARSELAKRSQEVKAIEKLRERRWAAHQLTEARAARKQEDEIAVQSFWVDSLETAGSDFRLAATRRGARLPDGIVHPQNQMNRRATSETRMQDRTLDQ